MLALAGMATSARAQENDTLRAAFSVLPASVLAPSGFDAARYVDLALLAEQNGGILDQMALSRDATASGLRPFDALAIAGPDQWSATSGVNLSDMRFIAGFGQPPREVAVWGLADEATAVSTFEGLQSMGFAPSGFLPGIIANGEPGHMDLAGRDPANPWSGAMGQTSVVTQQGASLLHAVDAAAFAPVLGGAALGDTDAGATLIAALEAQQGGVLQAWVFGPATGLDAGIDPAILLTASPEEARAAIEAQMGTSAAGVPLYGAAVMADVVGETEPQLLIAPAYGDCTIAEAAAARAAALWLQSAGGSVAGEATAGHVDAGARGCAATVTVPGAQTTDSIALPSLR